MASEAERVTYYALRESDELEATGLFRTRISKTAIYLEHIDHHGRWVKDNSLLRHLTGKDTGAERVSEQEAARIAQRLGGSIHHRTA